MCLSTSMYILALLCLAAVIEPDVLDSLYPQHLDHVEYFPACREDLGHPHVSSVNRCYVIVTVLTTEPPLPHWSVPLVSLESIWTY